MYRVLPDFIDREAKRLSDVRFQFVSDLGLSLNFCELTIQTRPSLFGFLERNASSGELAFHLLDFNAERFDVCDFRSWG